MGRFGWGIRCFLYCGHPGHGGVDLLYVFQSLMIVRVSIERFLINFGHSESLFLLHFTLTDSKMQGLGTMRIC